MTICGVVRATVAAVAIVVASLAPARAMNGRWQPPRIDPTTATLADVFAKRDAAAGTAAAGYARRIEHWSVRTNSSKLETVATVRDDDFRFDTTIDSATYSQGRAAGARWRQTPNGLVRLIGADVQGDDLDRWPLGILPYASSDCRLIGETQDLPKRYVVEYRPTPDPPHWFFFDETSGALTNEVEREGSRTIAFRFSDFRPVAGAVRPFAWHVDGDGEPADVTVESVDTSDVSADATKIPASRSNTLGAFENGRIDIPATFQNGTIFIDGTINGRYAHFLFDTGATQLLVNGSRVNHFGITPTLGHAVAADLSTGPVRFENVAVQTASLGDRIDGILGYEYFAGHIVHIDYKGQRVSLKRARPAAAGGRLKTTSVLTWSETWKSRVLRFCTHWLA